MRATREELHVARDELRNKAVLLDGARREASEAASSVERLTEECHGLRSDLQRQETLVVQRDEAIASLRDEACNGLLDGLPFKGGLLVPTWVWILTSTSLVMRRLKSPFLQTALRSQTLLLRPAPLLLTPELLYMTLLVFVFFFVFFFYAELRTRDICNVALNEYPIFCLIVFTLFSFFFLKKKNLRLLFCSA